MSTSEERHDRDRHTVVRDEVRDDVVVHDATGRRRFLRTGTALLLAGGGVAATRPALASDCDQAPAAGGEGRNPKQAAAGSDSDAGSGADPAGCGRRRDDPPAISHATPPAAPMATPRVARVRARGPESSKEA